MDAPLQEAFNQAKFSATLSLHLQQAYDKFIANCTYSHNGGVWVVDPHLIMWLVTAKNAMQSISPESSDWTIVVLDSKNKPISVKVMGFLEDIRGIYGDALSKYKAEYDALVKSRSIKKIVKHDV